MRMNARIASSVVVFSLLASIASAQQGVSRLKGRVVTERDEPVNDAEVRAEAFFGPAAGTFAGVRTFSTKTNAKGEWSILGISSGIWLFEAAASGYTPEAVVLPIRLLTASGPNAGGQMFTWDLILKPLPLPAGDRGTLVTAALDAAHAGKASDVRTLLLTMPADADAEFLAAAGRAAVAARQMDVAGGLFRAAIEKDPACYRAVLGMASIFLLQRDFDSASRAFDAARNRTHDKNEQRFISAALGDLATIKTR
jgi:hypothetical protein